MPEAVWLLETFNNMSIRYEISASISPEEFADLLRRSTLAERRPVDDSHCLQAMLRHANLLCTAWDDETLVGIARSVTDFEYCCYLSDLAVDSNYQRKGIGRELVRLTQARLGPRAKIILLAAPQAETYYPRIGFTTHKSAWILSKSASVPEKTKMAERAGAASPHACGSFGTSPAEQALVPKASGSR